MWCGLNRSRYPADGARDHRYDPYREPKGVNPPSNFFHRRTRNLAMFDRSSLDKLFDELRDEYELEPEWEDIQRDAHLAVARHDAGMPLGEIDSRVEGLVKKYSPD